MPPPRCWVGVWPSREDDLYANGAWLEGRHAVIERRLWQARPAPPKDQLFLYDVTSSYLEGDYNALAAWGYNRDHKENKKQVVVGLLTDSQGEPVSIQVYRGNTSDLKTFGQQVHKIKKELGCEGVTLVGDRGMIRTDQKAAALKAQFHFVTALTKPQIQKLLAEKVLQLEFFEEQVHEVLGEDGRRYVLRRNPVRQEELQESPGAEAPGAGSRAPESQPLPGGTPARPSSHPAPAPGGPAGKFQGAGLAPIVRSQAASGFDPRRRPRSKPPPSWTVATSWRPISNPLRPTRKPSMTAIKTWLMWNGIFARSKPDTWNSVRGLSAPKTTPRPMP